MLTVCCCCCCWCAQGRVGILYLSGEGEFVLIDEATGEETRQEVGGQGAAPHASSCADMHAPVDGAIALQRALTMRLHATAKPPAPQVKPGRFMSWKNTGNRHCLATNSAQKRRFIGPVVLDASKSGFIPVVDILVSWLQYNATHCSAMLRGWRRLTQCDAVAGVNRSPWPCPLPPTHSLLQAGPATPCNATTQCPVSMPTCKEGLCCAAAGSPAVRETFCCPGAMFW